MKNRAIKHFNFKATNLQEDLKKIDNFLNEETTGEVYEILINQSSSSSYAGYFFYHIFYEKLSPNEQSNTVAQRKISKIKSSSAKPKII